MISREDRREAEHQIARLIYTYCHRLDAADFEGTAALFEDAVWHITPQQTFRTSAQKAAWLRENLAVHRGKLGTRHMVANIVADVADDGHTATSWSYVLVSQVTDNFPLQLIAQARFEDAFCLGDDGWRFVSRKLHFDGAGDLSAHRRDAAPPE